MIVHITEAMIRQGRIMACAGCPVALALRQATGQVWIVCEEEAEAWGADEVIGLPAEATRFIRRFDAGFPVHPFEFEIDLEAAHA